MSKLRGIQKLVLIILREDKMYKKPYTERSEIVAKLGKLSLSSDFARHYAGDDVPILMRKVDQALYQLAKNKKIVRVDYGQWTLPEMPELTAREKHKINICRGLVKRGTSLWCSVRKSYISDPQHQCALMIGTDFSKKEWQYEGMKPCHMVSTPEPYVLEYMRNKYQEKETKLALDQGTWTRKFEKAGRLLPSEERQLRKQFHRVTPRTRIIKTSKFD
jgi:hypothetical protein